MGKQARTQRRDRTRALSRYPDSAAVAALEDRPQRQLDERTAGHLIDRPGGVEKLQRPASIPAEA